MLINIGFGNFIASQRVIGVFSPDSSPIKRFVKVNKNKENLVDVSCGRKTQSVVLMDTGHVFLSSMDSQTLCSKLDVSCDL